MIEAKSSNIIGNVIRYHRQRAGISQHALADLAGVGKTSVFDIEKGKPTIRLATLMAVLQTLNITINIDSPLITECKESMVNAEESS